MASSSSLLHWTRGMLSVRASQEVFGIGDFEICEADNEAVLAFVRARPVDETAEATSRDENLDRDGYPGVVCVNNLSSRPQATTVQLPERFHGAQVRDLFGGDGFPAVAADGTLTLTLGSRSFYWLGLSPRERTESPKEES